MWNSFKIEDKSYIRKLIQENDEIKFYLSDWKYIWSEKLNISAVLDRSKLSNPNIEPNANAVLETITKQMPISNTFDNEAQFKSKYYIDCVPFQFYWNLEKCNQSLFLEEITKPLLHIVIDKQEQYQELIKVIETKDKEIQQYKDEGAILIRTFLATQPFDKDAFQNKSSSKCSIFNVEEDSDILILKQISGYQKTIIDYINTSSLVSNSTTSSLRTVTTPSRKKFRRAIIERKFPTKVDRTITYGGDDDDDDDDDDPVAQTPTPPSSNEKINLTAVAINKGAKKLKKKLNL